MALHVRHKKKDNVQGRICLCTACVVLCATLFIHADGIPVLTLNKSQAPSVYPAPPAEQPQQQDTTATRIELSSQPPSEPEPICIIDPPPMLPDTEFQDTPLALNPAEGIEDTYCEHLFYSELTPEFEEAPPAQPPNSVPVTALTYTPPQYAVTPQPHYPTELKRRRISGTVRVRIHINPQGKPTAVDVISSTHPAFTQSAEQTILEKWQFHPARNGTSPVSATVVTSVQFII